MDEKMKKAIDAVFNELSAMPQAQFLKELELRGNGDIASILQYTGAFEVRETEAKGFLYSTPKVYVVAPLPKYKKGIANRFVHQVTFSSASEIKFDSINSYSTNKRVQFSLLNTLLNNSSTLYSTQNIEEDEWAA
ncbi:MAG: hypothetical protein HY887_06890 [Deltaproteobacteria bacterium]|nr:hypothetical protein [Deltaproteobacteria bacterium]